MDRICEETDFKNPNVVTTQMQILQHFFGGSVSLCVAQNGLDQQGGLLDAVTVPSAFASCGTEHGLLLPCQWVALAHIHVFVG